MPHQLTLFPLDQPKEYTMANVLEYLRTKTFVDDVCNRIAIIGIVIASVFGYSSGMTTTLRTAGVTTTTIVRTRKEETTVGMEDNDLSEPTDPLKTEADFIDTFYMASGPVQQEDYAGWKQYEADNHLYNNIQFQQP